MSKVIVFLFLFALIGCDALKDAADAVEAAEEAATIDESSDCRNDGLGCRAPFECLADEAEIYACRMVSDDERREARRQEREFWGNQMRTAESNFDYDGDGELNIDETNDAWNAWVEYQEVDTFITNYDTDGDRTMGPADYEAFLSAFDRKDDRADINNDGKINISDINAFRDLVIRSRNAS